MTPGRALAGEVIAEATRASADRARGIVLSGTAGVGKTRVAREAVASCGPRSARRHWIIGTDAAAQAVIAYQHAGLRGAAMTASATVQRLAAECQGADTPALRAAST